MSRTSRITNPGTRSIQRTLAIVHHRDDAGFDRILYYSPRVLAFPTLCTAWVTVTILSLWYRGAQSLSQYPVKSTTTKRNIHTSTGNWFVYSCPAYREYT